jgi:4-oxalocrotonate tautomerase
MPIVTVDALEGRTVEQKRGLVKDITEAVTKNFGVEPEAVTVIIRDMEKKNFAKAGKLRMDS